MSSEQYAHAVQQYIDSINAKNLQGIIELFADNATLEDPVGSEKLEGIEAIRGFYENGAIKIGVQIESTGPVRTAGNEAAFPFRVLINLGDTPSRIDVIDVFRFNDAGKVESMRAYWGPENMGPQ